MRGERVHLLQTADAYEHSAQEYARGKDDQPWLAPLIARLKELVPAPARR